MSKDKFIPKSVEDFYVKEKDTDGARTISKPPIAFNLQVIATDLPWYDDKFKIKILIDIVPEFTTERNRDKPNFNSARTREILNFVSDKIITKVAESVYYDPNNKLTVEECKDESFPPGYSEVQEIYERRRKEKPVLAKAGENGNGLSEEEEEFKFLRDEPEHKKKFPQDHDDERRIMNYVTRLLGDTDRPIWEKESDISRISYTILSNPSFGVERRTAVNGDKKLPR